MPDWLLPALFGSVAIGGHYLLLRAASGRLGDSIGALVMEGAAAFGVVVAFVAGVRGPPLPTTRLGVFFAAASGICISGASIALFAALRRGGPVASTGIVVLGGGVTLSALAAPFLFGESFTLKRGIGVALGVAAIAVLGSDR